MISFLVNVLLTAAVLYNIHHSFKNTSKPARKFYKHYFIVVSFLVMFDNAFSFVFYRIPYYQIFKLCLLGWISIPMGTGPHFIYNVYIKNIHNLFEGDIDSVIESFKGYFEQMKAKYFEMVNASKKSGQMQIGFSSSKLSVSKKPICESSEVDMSNSAAEDSEEKGTKPEAGKRAN